MNRRDAIKAGGMLAILLPVSRVPLLAPRSEAAPVQAATGERVVLMKFYSRQGGVTEEELVITGKATTAGTPAQGRLING